VPRFAPACLRVTAGAVREECSEGSRYCRSMSAAPRLESWWMDLQIWAKGACAAPTYVPKTRTIMPLFLLDFGLLMQVLEMSSNHELAPRTRAASFPSPDHEQQPQGRRMVAGLIEPMADGRRGCPHPHRRRAYTGGCNRAGDQALPTGQAGGSRGTSHCAAARCESRRGRLRASRGGRVHRLSMGGFAVDRQLGG
jgi:hypothetical protein